MPYIVVKNEQSVLSRVSPNALLSWIDAGVSRATEYRYAVLFETCSGALKCAGMQGGEVRRVSGPGGCPVWVADVARGDGAARGVVPSGGDCGLVEVE